MTYEITTEDEYTYRGWQVFRDAELGDGWFCQKDSFMFGSWDSKASVEDWIDGAIDRQAGICQDCD